MAEYGCKKIKDSLQNDMQNTESDIAVSVTQQPSSSDISPLLLVYGTLLQNYSITQKKLSSCSAVTLLLPCNFNHTVLILSPTFTTHVSMQHNFTMPNTFAAHVQCTVMKVYNLVNTCYIRVWLRDKAEK